MVERIKLSDQVVEKLEPPEQGKVRYIYDSHPSKKVRGFGMYILPPTSRGIVRTFFISYQTKTGVQRLQAIGRYPEWTVFLAREKAAAIRRRVDDGEDPKGDEHEYRESPTVDDLADKFISDHAELRKRPTSVVEDKALLRQWISPEIGRRKVAEIKLRDIQALHTKVTKSGTPARANAVVALLSTMFNLAVKWEMRPDSPCRGVIRNAEVKRERFLSPDELASLTKALNDHPNQEVANVFRLLLLTGARRGEVLNARWDQFDLVAGTWRKPAAATKQKKEHFVPLSAPAHQLLSQIRTEADAGPERARELEKQAGVEARRHRRLALLNAADRARLRAKSPFVFPAYSGDSEAALAWVVKAWHQVCKSAGLVELVAKKTKQGQPVLNSKGEPIAVLKHTVRIHDLRHSYASFLASSGVSLLVIGRLLGHTQHETTMRYSHLLTDPLKEATERVGAIINAAGKSQPSAEVVSISTASRQA